MNLYFGALVLIGIEVCPRICIFGGKQKKRPDMIPAINISTDIELFLRFFPTDVPGRNTYAGLLFILPLSGQATVEVDGRLYIVQPGVLLTLLPYHLVCTKMMDAEFRCGLLSFTFDAMTDFPYMLQSCISEKMERTPIIRLTSGESDRLQSLYETIATHHRLTTHPSYAEILRSFLFIFTAEVSAIYSEKPLKASATHGEELTDRFFRLLHEHFRTNREPAFYANHLCISPKYLSRMIHQVTGQVPSYWIADFTVREAKVQLKSTTLTVTQLSEQLCFPNSSFFARYFKRYAGVSPMEYRLGEKK